MVKISLWGLFKSPDRQGDQRNIHAHIMLTTRIVSADGFKNKERAWNDPNLLRQWRKRWGTEVNAALEANGIDDRVDHRSYQDRGIDREAQVKLGPVASALERRGIQTERGNINRGISARNSERDAIDAEIINLELERSKLKQKQYLEHHSVEIAKFEERCNRKRKDLDNEITQRQHQIESDHYSVISNLDAKVSNKYLVQKNNLKNRQHDQRQIIAQDGFKGLANKISGNKKTAQREIARLENYLQKIDHDCNCEVRERTKLADEKKYKQLRELDKTAKNMRKQLEKILRDQCSQRIEEDWSETPPLPLTPAQERARKRELEPSMEMEMEMEIEI